MCQMRAPSPWPCSYWPPWPPWAGSSSVMTPVSSLEPWPSSSRRTPGTDMYVYYWKCFEEFNETNWIVIKRSFYSRLLPWILLMEDFFEDWSAEGSSVSLIVYISGQKYTCHDFVTSSLMSRVTRVTSPHVTRAASHNLQDLECQLTNNNKTSLLC